MARTNASIVAPALPRSHIAFVQGMPGKIVGVTAEQTLQSVNLYNKRGSLLIANTNCSRQGAAMRFRVLGNHPANDVDGMYRPGPPICRVPGATAQCYR